MRRLRLLVDRGVVTPATRPVAVREGDLPMVTEPPDDIPHVLSDDAPTPATAEGDTVDTVIVIDGRRYVGADYDGERYCADCINEEYLRYGVEDPYQIPYGGPLPEGFENDCPGHACGNCLRHIEGQTLLHYDGVCGEYCPLDDE